MLITTVTKIRGETLEWWLAKGKHKSNQGSWENKGLSSPSVKAGAIIEARYRSVVPQVVAEPTDNSR